MPRRNNAGRYRHRAVIYQFDSSDAASGGDDGSWGATAASVWGNLRPLRGSEIERAQRNEGQEVLAFECRYNASLTKDKRLRINSKDYHIVGPPLDSGEMHREMVLTVRRAPTT